MELIRNWWNNGRDYFQGVAILSDLITDKDLLLILANGESIFKRKRLEKELLQILENGKKVEGERHKEKEQSIAIASEAKQSVKSPISRLPSQPDNPLHIAAHNDAMKVYVENQNKRAVLFSMADQKDFSDMNTPEKIAERRLLALEVLKGNLHASELFERADYVRENGRLPDTQTEVAELDLIPDDMVYTNLNNRRKSLSKLKKKEPTTERVAMILEREKEIELLAARWERIKNY